jgi:hypothetical protein
MALSLGEASKKAKLWNLLTGKVAVLFKLDKGLDVCLTVPSVKGNKLHFGRDFRDLPQVVKWSPNGTLFAVQWTAQLDVYDSAGSTKLAMKSVGFESRLTAFAWVTEDVIVLGNEEGLLVWISLAEEKVVRQEQLDSRVKDLTVMGGQSVCAATSAGILKVFEKESAFQINLDDRLTCICASSSAVVEANTIEAQAKEHNEEKKKEEEQPKKKKSKKSKK